MEHFRRAWKEIEPPKEFGKLEKFVVYASAAAGSVIPVVAMRYFVFQDLAEKNPNFAGEIYSWGISAGLGTIASLICAPMFANMARVVIERIKY